MKKYQKKIIFHSYSNNLEQNICRLFHVLAQYLFTISETELEHYYQKVAVSVNSRVVKRCKLRS